MTPRALRRSNARTRDPARTAPARGQRRARPCAATLARRKSELHRNDPRAALDRCGSRSGGARSQTASTAPLAPLENLTAKPLPLRELALHHRDDRRGICRAMHPARRPPSAGCDGAALASIFEEITESTAAGAFAVALADYPELFDAIAGEPHGAAARRAGRARAHLRSARSAPAAGRPRRARRIVEGIWPPETRSDPWLSRPMRQELGLDLPERRIGLSAHDFAQALGAPEVILTRAAKVARRADRRVALSAAARRGRRRRAVERNASSAARNISTGRARSTGRRESRSPANARHRSRRSRRGRRRLTVTEIEHWLRDPYTIYAKHILKLQRARSGRHAAGRARPRHVIHEAIGNFTRTICRTALPADPVGELIALGHEAFEPLDDYPEARAFWWPRFQRIARWFVGWEIGRRAGQWPPSTPKSRGEIDVTPDFVLGARADRIERLTDGRFAVLDYKTGQPPTDREVKAGLAPQLTLEGAIIRHGGFEGYSGRRLARRAALSAAERRRSGRQTRLRRNSRNRHRMRKPTRRSCDCATSWRNSRCRRRPINPSRGRNGSAAPIATTIISRA